MTENGPGTAMSPKPKKKSELRRLAREHSEQALNVLLAIMNDKDKAGQPRVQAANTILEWGYGKRGGEAGRRSPKKKKPTTYIVRRASDP